MWKLWRPNHAIESMNIYIMFIEPASSVVMRRMLRDIESASSAAGLINRQPTHAFQVSAENPQNVQRVEGSGMIFQRTSLVKTPNGVESQLMEQVDCQQIHLQYQTWEYSEWSASKAKFQKLLGNAIKYATQAVAIARIRVEYQDRFVFDGPIGEASAAGVLNEECDKLASHIFKSHEMWHSHMGVYENSAIADKRLIQVNADLQDLTAPPQWNGKRSLALMTACEDRFFGAGREFADESEVESIYGTLDDLHKHCISLFREVMNQSFRKENNLAL